MREEISGKSVGVNACSARKAVRPDARRREEIFREISWLTDVPKLSVVIFRHKYEALFMTPCSIIHMFIDMTYMGICA